jgi:hypothetical protein
VAGKDTRLAAFESFIRFIHGDVEAPTRAAIAIAHWSAWSLRPVNTSHRDIQSVST